LRAPVAAGSANCVTNCVRPLNVPRSLTAISVRGVRGRQKPAQPGAAPATSIAGGDPLASRLSPLCPPAVAAQM
jgi:hypothetical protein